MPLVTSSDALVTSGFYPISKERTAVTCLFSPVAPERFHVVRVHLAVGPGLSPPA